MRYISDDGKVFNTEQECLEHENMIKEKIEAERTKRLNIIRKQYEDLQKSITEYSKTFEIKSSMYFLPLHEFMSILG